MVPEIYWLPNLDYGGLAVMPRPRGDEWLEDEVEGWKEVGIDCVVSLLERHEIEELQLQDEESLCLAQGIGFISFPMPDRSIPTGTRPLTELARNLLDRLQAGQSIAVHCRAGIGRSALVAAAALVLSGIPAPEAFNRIEKARGLPVPDTEEQRLWLADFEQIVKRE